MNIKQYLQADKNIQHLLATDKFSIVQQGSKKQHNSNMTIREDHRSSITVPNSLTKKSLSISSSQTKNCESFNATSSQMDNKLAFNPHIKFRNQCEGPHSTRPTQAMSNVRINLSSKDLNYLTYEQLDGKEDHICYIDLSWNHLTKFDIKLTSLLDLNLQANQIAQLPRQFSELFPILENLNISKNQLQSIPVMPPSLTQLYINHNYLHVFPKSIAHLPTLLILHIQGNPFYILGNIPSTVEEIGLDWMKYAKGKEINRGEIAAKIKNWLNSTEINEKTFLNFVSFILQGTKFNPDNKDTFGRTMLHRAALAQDLGVIIGLRGKANPNLLDSQQFTPLFVSIKEASFHSAKYLLQIDCNPNIVHLIQYLLQICQSCGPYGSVISLCLVKQQFNLVHLLLQKGADANIIDKDGNTPLHYLMALWKDEEQYRQVALSLLAKGACSNIRNNSGYAPIHMCIRKGQVDACKFAINYTPAKQKITTYEGSFGCCHSFDIDIKSSKNGKTPLKLAALYNITGIVKVLIDEEVDLSHIHIMSTANAVAKMLKRRILEWQSCILQGVGQYKRGQHQGYFGFCSFKQDQGLNLQNNDNQYKQSEHDWYFKDKQSVFSEVKSFSCQPNRMTQRSKQDLRTIQALHRLEGDQELQVSESNCTNDSKAEGKGLKQSVIGDNALIHKMNSKNENSGKANILSYNGLRTPKLYNPHTETLKNIYQKWENIVNYFSSTGSHYQKEFKQSESFIVQMKLVGLMMKMHIQIVNMHRKIQNEISRIAIKGKQLQNNEKYIMMSCLMASLDDIILQEKEEEVESEQSLIQEEVQCQLQDQKSEPPIDGLLNNLSIGSISQSQKSIAINKFHTFEHERRTQIIDMLMHFVHRNFKYSVELNTSVNLLTSYECVQGRFYQKVNFPL